MDLSTRLREAINGSNKSAATIARETGVTQSSLSQILSKNVRGLRAETAAALELATGYRMMWLVTGKGPKFVDEDAHSAPGFSPGVPFLEADEVATWAIRMDAQAAGRLKKWQPCPVPHGTHTFAMRLVGTSMQDPNNPLALNDGDILYVDMGVQVHHRAIWLIQPDEDAPHIECRQILEEGSARFGQALNPAWPNRITQLYDNAKLIGAVVARLTEIAH